MISKNYPDLSLPEIKKLTESIYHEVRFCGLLILVSQFEKAKTRAIQKKLFEFYTGQLKAGYVNNWDLNDNYGNGPMSQRIIQTGAPFYFYFGLLRGKTAFDKYSRKWLNGDEILD